jgi:hypothetical protein
MMFVPTVKCPTLKHSIDFVDSYEQVGEDVVAELSRAMERQGLDMKVAALVVKLICLLFTSQVLTSHALCFTPIL